MVEHMVAMLIDCAACQRCAIAIPTSSPLPAESGLHAGVESEVSEPQRLEQLCITTIRTLAMDAVQKANSGHPGTPMALAPLAFVLWDRYLRHNPRNPHWPGRDRFILSNGHACMLLYAMLYLTGYNLSLDDIKQFRQWGSKTPGHPEYGHVPGLEVTTGPLAGSGELGWNGKSRNAGRPRSSISMATMCSTIAFTLSAATAT